MLNCFQMQENTTISIKLVSKQTFYKQDSYAGDPTFAQLTIAPAMIYLTTKSESESINWVSGSGRVRIKITHRIRVRVRVGVMFSISIYHGSNCHRSKSHTFSSAVWKPSLSVFTFPQTVWIFSQTFCPIIPSPTTYTLSSFILSSPSCQIYLTHSPVLVCLRLNPQIGWFSRKFSSLPFLVFFNPVLPTHSVP